MLIGRPCHELAKGVFSRLMKAVTVNISLSSELAEFVRRDCAAQAFDSMSEYMRELIRRRRRERMAEEVELLEQAMAGAPVGDPSDEEMAEIIKTQRRIRAGLKRARRA
jgi:Arc/MetJ-type ribon-helix-helix transcriptional regulator